jgi:hypothetical protein
LLGAWGHETAALIGVEGLTARQGDQSHQGSISAFLASAGQFLLHWQASFSCIRSPAFPASVSQFFLH